MKLNERGGAYEAPRIEWLDVAVEAGFAASNEVQGSTGGWCAEDDANIDGWSEN